MTGGQSRDGVHGGVHLEIQRAVVSDVAETATPTPLGEFVVAIQRPPVFGLLDDVENSSSDVTAFDLQWLTDNHFGG